MTKIIQSSKTTPGDLLKVKCKVHGRQTLIAGVDFPAGTPFSEIECSHCRTVESGEKKVGTGFIDSRGVPYIVDIHGNLRHAEKLKDHQSQRIMKRKESK